MQATALKTPDKVWIPKLPTAEMVSRIARIRPVVSVADMKYFIQPVDPFNRSFRWDVRTTEMALLLKRVEDILTYHPRKDKDTFRPTVAEVLAIIPAKLTGHVVAFEVIRHLNAPIDLEEHREAVEAGYHVAQTRLYRDA